MRIMRDSLVSCVCVVVQVLTAEAVHAQTANRDAPDYRSPARAYKEVKIGGRTFVVEKQLMDEDRITANRALKRLKKNIDLALSILPVHAKPHVAKQKFWLMYGPKAKGGALFLCQ